MSRIQKSADVTAVPYVTTGCRSAAPDSNRQFFQITAEQDFVRINVMQSIVDLL